MGGRMFLWLQSQATSQEISFSKFSSVALVLFALGKSEWPAFLAYRIVRTFKTQENASKVFVHKSSL